MEKKWIFGKIQIFRWFSDLWKNSDFWKNSRFLEKIQILGKNQILGNFLDFWKKLGFLEKIHFSLFTFHFTLNTFHVGQPEMLADWKSESVTYLLTYLQTWVGARDDCVSKKQPRRSTSL